MRSPRYPLILRTLLGYIHLPSEPGYGPELPEFMQSIPKQCLVLGFLLCGISAGFQRLHSATIDGVDFPQGFSSFADKVELYTPGKPEPARPHRHEDKSLGPPDHSSAGISTVSLGKGGVIVLRFTDNVLTGSGSTNKDLWIFEAGPDVEDTFVDISKDGVEWFPVGKVTGGTRGIDIDKFGFGPEAKFSYVRLTDDPNEGASTGVSVGADIDAVGAISSQVAPPVVDIDPTLPQVGLCWESSTNLLYQIEYKDELRNSRWLQLGGQFLGVGTNYCTNLASPASEVLRFYRVTVTKAP